MRVGDFYFSTIPKANLTFTRLVGIEVNYKGYKILLAHVENYNNKENILWKHDKYILWT